MLHCREALTNLGYDALARQEAQKAFDLSANLFADERLTIEGASGSDSRMAEGGGELSNALALFT